jgi:citrate synthase
VTAAVSTLAGSLHGGANERVLRTAQSIGSPDAVDDFVHDAFANRRKIHGFGQRGCKAEDPRAILLRGMAEEVSARKGGSDILPILLAMNRAVQSHRELWPNVDFYSAAILHDLGIDTDLFTPLFACSRVVGWSAHVAEQVDDNRLIRPKAKYAGQPYRPLG